MQTLTERIDEAIRRISEGSGLMRIPVDQTDPDMVLGDCKARIAALEAENARLKRSLSMRRVHATEAVANAFWKYWRENGETHKHGYYESTWGAINAALAASDSGGAK